MDSEVKTIVTETQEREALHHVRWLAAAIRERGRIGRKRLYRMRPKGMSVLEFETAVRKLREEGKIAGTNILSWTAE